MKNIKTRLERLERAKSYQPKEPLVILFSAFGAEADDCSELEPRELCSGLGHSLVAQRRCGESLDELIARVQREYPDQQLWTGWYRPADESGSTKTIPPIPASLARTS